MKYEQYDISNDKRDISIGKQKMRSVILFNEQMNKFFLNIKEVLHSASNVIYDHYILINFPQLGIIYLTNIIVFNISAFNENILAIHVYYFSLT